MTRALLLALVLGTLFLSTWSDAMQHTRARVDDFVEGIIKHEGLLPGQTPFRITSDKMARFNTILGFPVSDAKKPRGREDFFFLEDPTQVPAAVEKQFRRYLAFPERFGLPRNPTISQAVRVFDQTGAGGKLDFLRQLGFDDAAPLASLFEEAL